MRIAIPVKQGKYSLHFSNCDQFAIIDVREGSRQIIEAQYMTPPSFDIDILPAWIRSIDVSLIITGGMPQHVQKLFAKKHIDVQVGAFYSSLKAVVSAFIDSQVQPGGTTEVSKL